MATKIVMKSMSMYASLKQAKYRKIICLQFYNICQLNESKPELNRTCVHLICTAIPVPNKYLLILPRIYKIKQKKCLGLILKRRLTNLELILFEMKFLIRLFNFQISGGIKFSCSYDVGCKTIEFIQLFL